MAETAATSSAQPTVCSAFGRFYCVLFAPENGIKSYFFSFLLADCRPFARLLPSAQFLGSTTIFSGIFEENCVLVVGGEKKKKSSQILDKWLPAK